jgi:hypothetical protein
MAAASNLFSFRHIFENPPKIVEQLLDIVKEKDYQEPK